ncbi:DUF1501 domain-containing protein [Pirellulaceae bacterium]|nr:DUF1501 domain-containing protein [Pirellulaceae bacterium]
MYGDSEYAKGCLLARRMIERGVRCVQLPKRSPARLVLKYRVRRRLFRSSDGGPPITRSSSPVTDSKASRHASTSNLRGFILHNNRLPPSF